VVVELRPLLDEHTDPLVADLEVLATTLSTVERNLDRLGEMFRGSRNLFEAAGRAVEYDAGRIKLNNQTTLLGESIRTRTADRLAGLCLRLGITECGSRDFFEPILGTLLCAEAPNCVQREAVLQDYLITALSAAPPEVLDLLVEEVRAAEAEESAEPDEDGAAEPDEEVAPPPELPSVRQPGRLPLPDPRLQRTQEEESAGLLGRLFGGSR
jgi:phospholipid/cholesterol/gamma-HCH transport system substrate-binding protein